jgi:biotin-(acetyl-CoA carboxylase) ligase
LLASASTSTGQPAFPKISNPWRRGFPLLAAYERSFDSLMSEPAAVIARWAAVAALDGKRVSVKAPDRSLLHEGEVVGIGSDGALLLRTAGGDVRVMLGDVAAI